MSKYVYLLFLANDLTQLMRGNETGGEVQGELIAFDAEKVGLI